MPLSTLATCCSSLPASMAEPLQNLCTDVDGWFVFGLAARFITTAVYISVAVSMLALSNTCKRTLKIRLYHSMISISNYAFFFMQYSITGVILQCFSTSFKGF